MAKNTKDIKTDAPVELKDGQKVSIDGKDFIFDKGHFRLDTPEEKNSGDKHFYLYFRDVFAKDLDANEIKGCPVKHTDGRVIVDIAPIIKELFRPEARSKMRELKGISEIGYTDSETETISLPFSQQSMKKINKSLATMLDMSIVNQKQRQGFEDYIDNIFSDFWSGFWR